MTCARFSDPLGVNRTYCKCLDRRLFTESHVDDNVYCMQHSMPRVGEPRLIFYQVYGGEPWAGIVVISGVAVSVIIVSRRNALLWSWSPHLPVMYHIFAFRPHQEEMRFFAKVWILIIVDRTLVTSNGFFVILSISSFLHHRILNFTISASPNFRVSSPGLWCTLRGFAGIEDIRVWL